MEMASSTRRKSRGSHPTKEKRYCHSNNGRAEYYKKVLSQHAFEVFIPAPGL